MKPDATGRPVVGSEKYELGVRVPIDVTAPEGMVARREGGMSVAPDDPRRLPTIVRPEAWGGLAEGALEIFGMEVADLDPSVLHFARSGSKHGYVQAESPMSLADYQSALADTGPRWTKKDP